MNALNQIVVQCPREKTTHARITAYEKKVVVEYGRTYPSFAQPFSATGEREELFFAEYPELAELYQDSSWNVPALICFIMMNIETVEEATAV